MLKFFFICCVTTALALPQGYNYHHQHNTAASENSITIVPTLMTPKFLQDALKQKQQLLRSNTAVSHSGSHQQQYQSGASSINLNQQLPQPQQQQQLLLQPQQQNQQFQLQPHQYQQQQSQQQPLLQQLTSVQNFLPIQPATLLQQQQPTTISQQQHQQPPTTLQQQQQRQFSQLPSQISQTQSINHHPQSGPVVTKDIYVHIPPSDDEQQQSQLQQQQYNPPPPRKHYRIVFVKAPTPNTRSNALHLTQAPIEEKTIIYVLTKKPDSTQLQATLQDSLTNYKPTKPEVYFIKYKTPEEAQNVQRVIQAQYDKLGGTTQISDEGVAPLTSVIGSLDVRSNDNNNIQTTTPK